MESLSQSEKVVRKNLAMPGPRPTLTKAKAKTVLDHLGGGETLAKACESGGVGLSSYYRRIDRYPDILEEIKRVLSTQKQTRRERAIETILAAFEKDWKAAAWWLERNYPHEFGRYQPNTTPVIPTKIEVVEEEFPLPDFLKRAGVRR